MDEAIQLVDKWLSIASGRTIMSSEEVSDLLLDVRLALTRKPLEDEPVIEPEPVPVG